MSEWSETALAYFDDHAIDPAVAVDLGVREEGGALIYPTVDPDGAPAPRRRLLGEGPKTIGLAGAKLALYWPRGERGGRVLFAEGESDALAVESVRALAATGDGAAAYVRSAFDAVCAVPGTGFGARRLVDALNGAGVEEALLAFDGDDAGRRYRDRVTEELAAAEIRPLPIELPDGEDLASVLAAADDRLLTFADLLAGAVADEDEVEEPPTESIDVLLELVGEMIDRYVVLPGRHERVVLALFTAHTYALDGAHATPYVLVISPEKRSGKSRLLGVLELMVARPWNVIGASEAAMFRKIAKHRPTLELDEIDAIFGSNSERTEPLRAILNAGNRPGATVARCVGEKQEVEDFPIFCAKVLAGIDSGHRIPDTIRDRAIAIHMQRKTGAEVVQRFRHRDADAEAAPIRDALDRWAGGACDVLLAADPLLPGELDDRAAEAWEPLLAIADLAGGEWPARARGAAVALSGEEDREEVAIGTLLLRAINKAYEDVDRLSTVDLLVSINADEELPFGGWREGKGLDPRGLARLLRPYRVKSRSIRLGEEVAKGYLRSQFDEVWDRWLPSPAGTVTSDTSVTEERPEETAPPFSEADVTDVTDVTAPSGGSRTATRLPAHRQDDWEWEK